jgi:hypothetical protein
MKAVVFHKPADMRLDEGPDPKIEAADDIIVRVTATAICGSDLHIYNGFLPQTRPMVMGHEFMGIVEEAGKGVSSLKRGDRVVVPFPIACGACFFCGHGLPGHCENSNPEKYGPEGGPLDQKKAERFSATRICMADTRADKRSMYGFLMQTLGPERFATISATNRSFSSQISFPRGLAGSSGQIFKEGKQWLSLAADQWDSWRKNAHG